MMSRLPSASRRYPIDRLPFRVTLPALGCALAALAALASGWESYEPVTLAQVIAVHADVGGVDRVINTAEEKYRVQVTHLGGRRPLPESTRTLIVDWARAVGVESQLISAFKQEIEVAEAGKSYWLPVQDVLLPHMGRELAAGDSVRLYVMWIGYVETRWVFLVNEFERVERDQAEGRGPNRMTAAPIRHTPAPSRSQRSGTLPSMIQSHMSEAAM